MPFGKVTAKFAWAACPRRAAGRQRCAAWLARASVVHDDAVLHPVSAATGRPRGFR
jgi:hypothetical protein